MRILLWSFAILATLCFIFSNPIRAEDDVTKPAYDLTPEQEEKVQEQGEKFHFQAEVSRMMHLIINSLYRNKEIFLRELISNASDALDKIRFLSLTHSDILGKTTDLSIKIQADKEKNILHIVDTGIGMTKDDLKNNLGTIAKSGTSEFLKKIEEGNDMNLIGQFGVGFYSVFLVADKVTVTTKHNDDKQYIWESTADSDFTIIEDPRGNTLGRGTVISLHLKPEAVEFLEQDSLKTLVQKYSEFINFPIYLWTTSTKTVEVPLTEEELAAEAEKEKETEEKGEDEEVEDVEEEATETSEEEKKPKTKQVEEQHAGFERVNENKPIWVRSPSDVTEEEYQAFYKAFFKQQDEAITHSHFKAEGEVEFRSLLYISSRPPPNLYSTEPINEIKLFVRRVFITDTEMEPLLPNYLRFIRGVVDSDDLPLNVSRETLQQSKLLKVIKKKLVKKALDMLKDLAEKDKEKYEKFYQEYSASIKLGIIEDNANKKRLAKLLRFKSSESGSSLTTFDEYISRLKKGQENIYYLSGASIEEIESSPFLERLTARGFEVLYLPDPIDEYTIQGLTEYEGKKLMSAAKDGLKLGDEDEDEKHKETEKNFEVLTDWLKERLSDLIDKAVISRRLTHSPCALVAKQWGWTGNMERIMSSQAYSKSEDNSASFYKTQKKILEINPKHPLIVSLLEKVENEESNDELVPIALTLYDLAALRSSFAIAQPKDFAKRVEELLADSLKISREFNIEHEEERLPLASESKEEEPQEEVQEESEEPIHDEL